ncbi:MAG TPA: SGNH/GDSL hydrolase family protein, partial [Gemmatimonadaceae bacterium]|nr:SGNH/GDSL hydrolase family protein [Gemmatimonadaceae bacterium]
VKGLTIATLIVAGAACEKADTGVEPGTAGADFSKYVAMGTSVSMGFASDGVVAASQQSSWPKLLADDIGATFTLPLIDSPGCPPPFAAPLGQLKRTDNSSILTQSNVCAANSAGVTLPAQNVAISAQTAAAAVAVIPQAGTLAARVLATGQTQASAMRAQNPTFVSVEFGGGEVLPAMSGLVSTGVTIATLAAFTAGYQVVIDNVKATGAKALLVTLPADLAKFPTLRTGAEIASQRAALLTRNVSVNANCDASTNMIAMQKVLDALAQGAIRAAGGLAPFDLSCADVSGTVDGVLTPGDITTLNALVTGMNAFINAKATENGYAAFSLGVLYDTAKDGVAFDVNTILTSTTPFGPNISLDSVHPSAAGNQILAAAAKAAVVAKYGTITK